MLTHGEPSPALQVILSIQMLDRGTSEVRWQASGQLGPLPINVSIRTRLEHNQVTGKVIDHRWVLPASPSPLPYFPLRPRPKHQI